MSELASKPKAPIVTAALLEPTRVTRGQWMALTAALLGWMFDGAEMGVFSMVGRPALIDLMHDPGEQQIGLWFGVVTAGFLVGAATGGVVFGWLGDRIGRVRAMTLSVLTYAIFTGLCGFSTQPWHMGLLRFIASLGMGGEWSLGVALVMEVWPNRSRAFMAGLIGAAANVGYMLVGFVGIGLTSLLAHVHSGLLRVGMSAEMTETLTHNQGWRILMMMGTLPALLTFLIRLFVPESQRWEEERQSGTTSNWAARDLWGVLIGVAGPALIIYLWATENSMPVRLIGSLAGLLFAVVGYIYPVLRFLQRQRADGVHGDHTMNTSLRRMLLAAGLASVALLGTWGSTQWAPSWASKLTKGNLDFPHAKEVTQIWLAVGAITGTIAAAFLGDWLGRRVAYSILCVLSFGSVYLLYQTNTMYDDRFLFCTFIAGACTASFYGWLPLYLPELFPTRIRATGQGFGFNFGRIIAAIGALQVGNLFVPEITLFGRQFVGGYPFACTAISLIYFVGFGLIWFAPETRGKPLPD